MELQNAKVVGGTSIAIMLSTGRWETRFSPTETAFLAKCFVAIMFWCLCAKKKKHLPFGLGLTTYPTQQPTTTPNHDIALLDPEEPSW